MVPETTTETAMALLKREAAEVIVHGASWQEANAFAQSQIGETDAFIHPFDDPLIWDGHASMIEEIARATRGLSPPTYGACDWPTAGQSAGVVSGGSPAT